MSRKLNILQGMDCYLPDVDGVVNCMHNYCTHLSDGNNVTAAVPKTDEGIRIIFRTGSCAVTVYFFSAITYITEFPSWTQNSEKQLWTANTILFTVILLCHSQIFA